MGSAIRKRSAYGRNMHQSPAGLSLSFNCCSHLILQPPVAFSCYIVNIKTPKLVDIYWIVQMHPNARLQFAEREQIQSSNLRKSCLLHTVKVSLCDVSVYVIYVCVWEREILLTYRCDNAILFFVNMLPSEIYPAILSWKSWKQVGASTENDRGETSAWRTGSLITTM